MAEIKIAGVMRAGAFSPNHIGNDTAIFNLTADALRKRGCRVNVYSEEEFRNHEIDEPVVMAMCREPESVAKLKRLEDGGHLAINSGYGIENCTREIMTRLLLGNGIPYPDSLIVNTNESVRDEMEEKGFSSVWIKRGDIQTIHREDVSFCRHPEEAQEVLHEYFYRGIKRAVINRHLTGDLIKFYGIAGTDFFYAFYPLEAVHEKYNDLKEQQQTRFYPVDKEVLRATCERAAGILDVKIYGGDCIVAPDGTFQIIDFNDWPSFAPCRDTAAVKIAKAIYSMATRKTGGR